jgi:hypothetical protein
LFIGLDANFRLKHLAKKGKGRDSELGPGWAYFADPKGLADVIDIANKNPPPLEVSALTSTFRLMY